MEGGFECNAWSWPRVASPGPALSKNADQEGHGVVPLHKGPAVWNSPCKRSLC